LVRKTRMVWLPCGEIVLKISLFVLTEFTNMTDGHRMTAEPLHSIAWQT